MSAEDNLGRQFISLTANARHGTVNAYTEEGRHVGRLEWNAHSKRIKDINVHEEYQHQGIASHMWDLAHQASKEEGIKGPKHSTELTYAGSGWAKHVGGDIPSNARSGLNYGRPTLEAYEKIRWCDKCRYFSDIDHIKSHEKKN